MKKSPFPIRYFFKTKDYTYEYTFIIHLHEERKKNMETRTTKVSKVADSRNYLSVTSSVGNHADQNNILATLYVFG